MIRILCIASAVAALTAVAVRAGQQSQQGAQNHPPSAVKAMPPLESKYAPPRTPDGQPDISGLW